MNPLTALAAVTAVTLLALAAPELRAAPAHDWQTYVNARFRYSICYPADLLVPQGEPTNGDGQVFAAADGTRLMVFGRENALGEELRSTSADSRSRLAGDTGTVNYQVLRSNWFALSGRRSDSIFYAETRARHHQLKSFELVYDHAHANDYDPVASRIAGCFRDLDR